MKEYMYMCQIYSLDGLQKPLHNPAREIVAKKKNDENKFFYLQLSHCHGTPGLFYK